MILVAISTVSIKNKTTHPKYLHYNIFLQICIEKKFWKSSSFLFVLFFILKMSEKKKITLIKYDCTSINMFIKHRCPLNNKILHRQEVIGLVLVLSSFLWGMYVRYETSISHDS